MGERMDISQIRGADVRAIRMKMGLSQGEFGARLGVGQSVVSAYERGETSPGAAVVSQLVDFAKAVGLAVEQPNRQNDEYLRMEGEVRALRMIVHDKFARIEATLLMFEKLLREMKG